jgi:hypothetical protein
MFLIEIIGINTNNNYYMDLFAFILIITYVFTKLIYLFVIHLFSGHPLNVDMFINIYNILKKNSLSYDNIFNLVIVFNSIFIVKSIILKYILLDITLNEIYNLYTSSDDGVHDSVSDDNSEVSGSDNGSPNPNSNSDVIMGDTSDHESYNDSNTYYNNSNTYCTTGHDLDNNENVVEYSKPEDIPSNIWGGAYFNPKVV